MLFFLFAAGIVISGSLLAWLRAREGSPVARLLSRDLRTRPSGAGGTFTRGDHLAGAARSLIAGMLVAGVAAAGGWWSEHGGGNLGFVVMFVGGVCVMMAAAMLLVALVRAAVGWKGGASAAASHERPS